MRHDVNEYLMTPQKGAKFTKLKTTCNKIK